MRGQGTTGGTLGNLSTGGLLSSSSGGAGPGASNGAARDTGATSQAGPGADATTRPGTGEEAGPEAGVGVVVGIGVARGLGARVGTGEVESEAGFASPAPGGGSPVVYQAVSPDLVVKGKGAARYGGQGPDSSPGVPRALRGIGTGGDGSDGAGTGAGSEPLSLPRDTPSLFSGSFVRRSLEKALDFSSLSLNPNAAEFVPTADAKEDGEDGGAPGANTGTSSTRGKGGGAQGEGTSTAAGSGNGRGIVPVSGGGRGAGGGEEEAGGEDENIRRSASATSAGSDDEYRQFLRAQLPDELTFEDSPKGEPHQPHPHPPHAPHPSAPARPHGREGPGPGGRQPGMAGAGFIGHGGMSRGGMGEGGLGMGPGRPGPGSGVPLAHQGPPGVSSPAHMGGQGPAMPPQPGVGMSTHGNPQVGLGGPMGAHKLRGQGAPPAYHGHDPGWASDGYSDGYGDTPGGYTDGLGGYSDGPGVHSPMGPLLPGPGQGYMGHGAPTSGSPARPGPGPYYGEGYAGGVPGAPPHPHPNRSPSPRGGGQQPPMGPYPMGPSPAQMSRYSAPPPGHKGLSPPPSGAPQQGAPDPYLRSPYGAMGGPQGYTGGVPPFDHGGGEGPPPHWGGGPGEGMGYEGGPPHGRGYPPGAPPMYGPLWHAVNSVNAHNMGSMNSMHGMNGYMEDGAHGSMVDDPMRTLTLEFPGYSAESLMDIFLANGSDLGRTVEMLTQLEVRGLPHYRNPFTLGTLLHGEPFHFGNPFHPGNPFIFETFSPQRAQAPMRPYQHRNCYLAHVLSFCALCCAGLPATAPGRGLEVPAPVAGAPAASHGRAAADVPAPGPLRLPLAPPLGLR